MESMVHTWELWSPFLAGVIGVGKGGDSEKAQVGSIQVEPWLSPGGRGGSWRPGADGGSQASPIHHRTGRAVCL